MKYTEYLKYKIENPNKVILVKAGNFFHTFDVDALILELLLGYKVTVKKEIKVGFPLSSIERVKEALENKNIDYFIAFDNQRKEFDSNSYLQYKDKVSERYACIEKYKHILEKLDLYASNKDEKTDIINEIYAILK